MMTDEERKVWLAIRKEAGFKIDPETAEVEWTYGRICGPDDLDVAQHSCLREVPL